MKKNGLVMLIVGGLIAGWVLQPVVAGKGGGTKGERATLTVAEAEDLLFMREEEKLARDVYTALNEEWNLKVFAQIAQSEQRHMDAIWGLLSKYGLEDPALGVGEFANPDLQQLFDELVTVGLESKLAALRVGALIEEVDLEDLVAAMERTERTDILNVYGNLCAGSENHLTAFVHVIERITGEPYVAQWIPQTDVNGILGR